METHELKRRPINQGSLFGQDHQAQLLNSLKKNEIRTFRRLAKSSEVNLDHIYGYPDYKTCLDIACCDPKKHEFVEILLEHGVNVNEINESHKKAPLHFAVESGSIKTIKLLLGVKKTKKDILSKGNTPLHLAIKQIKKISDDDENREASIKKYEEIVEILLKSGCDPNIPDLKNTPIHSAAKQGLENIIKIIFNFSKSPIDLDSWTDSDEQTAREVLKENFPHLLLNKSEREEINKVDVHTLWSHLSNHYEDRFCHDYDRIPKEEDKKKMLEENNGMYTFLQFACDKGLFKVVEKLLNLGADPNLTTPGNGVSPSEYACMGGYYKILKLLDSNPNTTYISNKGDSLFNIAVKESKNPRLDDNVDYDQCIQILLESKRDKPDINAVDVKGSTALHYAAKCGNQELVLDLLRNGSYVGIFNKFDDPPLVDMSADTFETFLDECITTNSEKPYDDDYEIKFNYKFLVPPSDASKDKEIEPLINKSESILSRETDVLLYMTRNPEMKHLLTHPVITSFLYLKWQRISCLFYANITFYTTFWLSLLLYILFEYDEIETKSNAKLITLVITKYLSIIGLFLLILREVFQAIVSPKQYAKNFENYLEVALIIITFNIMFNGYIGEHPKQQLCAVAILLSSAELVLLIGNFPTLSTYIEMLKTVSWNFFKFILWYCILIIAFALSFYTLFRTTSKEGHDEKVPFDPNDDKETDFFVDPGLSLLKTIIMLTGEFDAGSIKFDLFPVTSHIIFIVFVFVIPIVLFNLLNGLAVSDTQTIRTNAELVGLVSRVKLISYFENVFIGDSSVYRSSISKIQNNCCWLPGYTCIKSRLICIKPLAKRICLFPHFLPNAKIAIKVNQSNVIEIITNVSKVKQFADQDDSEIGLCCMRICCRFTMDKKIIKATRNLINERKGDVITLKKVMMKLLTIEQYFVNMKNG